MSLLSEFEGLNMGNYTDDDVRRLNNWALDAYDALLRVAQERQTEELLGVARIETELESDEYERYMSGYVSYLDVKTHFGEIQSPTELLTSIASAADKHEWLYGKRPSVLIGHNSLLAAVASAVKIDGTPGQLEELYGMHCIGLAKQMPRGLLMLI